VAKSIKSETTVSLVVIGSVVGAIFTAYQIFSPAFAQIQLNESQLEMRHEINKSLKKSQLESDKHMLLISNSLSRIEGRLQKD